MRGWGEPGLYYAFPPFAVVGRVVDNDKYMLYMRVGTDVLVVAPEWTTPYWYLMLCNDAVGNPLYLSNVVIALQFHVVAPWLVRYGGPCALLVSESGKAISSSWVV